MSTAPVLTPSSTQEIMETEENDPDESLLTEFHPMAPETLDQSDNEISELPAADSIVSCESNSDSVSDSESDIESELDSQDTIESETEQEMYLQCDTESYLNSNHIQQEYLKKIYSESDISLCAANCAIMKFATSNHLTYSAINDLLTLLKFLCPKPNIIPSTIYKLKKFFNDHTIPYTSQTYCTKCHQKECQCEQPQSANIGNLVSINIDKPLQAVLSGKKLY